MATVIDSFVITLGLDSSNFTKGQREAYDSAKKLESQQISSAKNIEQSANRTGDAIGGIRAQALGLFAVITGASGLVQFASQAISAGAAAGRLSRNINVGVETITKFQALASVFGGSAEGMASSFIQVTDALAGWKVGDVRQIVSDFRALGAAGGTIIDINKGVDETFKDIAKNLAVIHDKDPQLGGYWQRRLGLDPGLYDAMIQKGETFNELLAKMHGLTQAEADAAGKLDRSWNTFTQNATRGVQSFILDFIERDTADVKDWEMIKGWYNKLTGGGSAQAATPPTVAGGGAATGTQAWRTAIANIESRGSGGYSALGPVTRTGDRAYGKYQIMGNNIGDWSQAALGKRMTAEEFMNNPDAQDRIFDHRFGQYVKQYGTPQDAASAWLTGRPLSSGGNSRDQLGTSGAEYARRFTAEGGGGGTTTSTVNIASLQVIAPPGSDPDAFAGAISSAIKMQSHTAQANGGAH